MELWVRSQDKMKLIKVNNIELEHHYSYKNVVENYMPPNATSYASMQTRTVQKKDKYIKSVISCNDEITLGTYKSEQRALKVLNEIQRHLVNINDSRDSYFYVYEMPKE